MKNILMIEDDRGLNQVIGDRLKADGYGFTSISDGTDGLQQALNGEYDILLLDLMLPDVSGFDIIREIRSHGKVLPIIIISARFKKDDKISGFKLGADDYLVKPFDFDELLARIEAHLRRDRYFSHKEERESGGDWLSWAHRTISFGKFTLDFKQCILFYQNSIVPLSKVEFRLLSYLLLNSDRVVPYNELMEKVWNYEEAVSSRTLYVHTAWLRKKINSHSKKADHIKTVRGIGYQFKY